MWGAVEAASGEPGKQRLLRLTGVAAISTAPKSHEGGRRTPHGPDDRFFTGEEPGQVGTVKNGAAWKRKTRGTEGGRREEERRVVMDCLLSSACTCRRANWSGDDNEEKGVSHIRAFPQGQLTSGSAETGLPPPPPPQSQEKRPVLSSAQNDSTWGTKTLVLV